MKSAGKKLSETGFSYYFISLRRRKSIADHKCGALFIQCDQYVCLSVTLDNSYGNLNQSKTQEIMTRFSLTHELMVQFSLTQELMTRFTLTHKR